jgi:hypothetical protein
MCRLVDVENKERNFDEQEDLVLFITRRWLIDETERRDVVWRHLAIVELFPLTRVVQR